MAQAPDQFTEDPSLTSEDGNQGKMSLLGKLKHKTKDRTSRLKTKLKHGSKTGEDTSKTGEDTSKAEEDDSSSGSSDDESDAPVHNAMSGVTQPAYGRQSEGEKQPESENKGSAAVPTQNFPGSFTGIGKGVPDAETKDDSDLSKDFEGLSTNDDSESMKTEAPSESGNIDESDSSKPMVEKLGENVAAVKGKTQEKFSGTGESYQSYTSPDGSSVPEQAQQTGEKVSEAGKSWGQWAAEKVGYAKDTAGQKAVVAKDTVAANVPTTADGTPIHEKAYGTAVEKGTAAKDSLAAQMPDPNAIPSDPAQQTYVQKATGGIYGAKDKLFTSTQPGEHDKALSQQVTESVGNLPATLKTSFGFGGKTSPTSSDVSPTDEASGALPQSPGIVSRITGLFGAKKPATDVSTPSGTTVSETGSETATKVSESADLS